MLPWILGGLIGAAITAVAMVDENETKCDDEDETIEILDKAKQALNLSQEVITQRDIHIEELEQLISELTAKHVVNHAEVIEPINTYL